MRIFHSRDLDRLRHSANEIHDNGRGIRAGAKAKRRHFGLLGMNERAILLCGMIGIRGVRGRGTLVTMRVPLARSAKGVEGT